MNQKLDKPEWHGDVAFAIGLWVFIVLTVLFVGRLLP